ncbi:hypothetical protein HXP44_17230 [Streptomyces sioyaensis]|uniref:hypothetical protein n=1 Tax=Streptomyces sioyaensis TaxID=67364 RepID=UPI001386D57E|nr:hypothetical protein [Streptomyces sioyaensis]MBM4793762.1 hypothetical protein [Streptomyces sioyaensis]
MKISSAARSLFSSPAIGRNQALTAAEQISATTHLMSSLELLATDRDRREGGLNNWAVARGNFATGSPRVRRILDAVAHRRSTHVIHVTRAIAAASLLVPGTHRRHRAAANGFLALTSVATHPRHHYGSDGSDQLSFLVQLVATVARLGERQPRIVDACLWYVALQSTLSYAVSGWVKVTSPVWRSGAALPGIMRTETYGDEKVYRVIQRHPRISTAVGHLVLAMECGFPAVFLAQGKYAPAVLTVSGAFHLANARVMGLGRFVWAFLATYPAVLYTAGGGAHSGGGR